MSQTSKEFQPAVHLLEVNPDGNPTVLLIHGLGATSTSWQLQIPILVEAGYHVLAPDLPGFGQSGWHGRAWNVPRVTRRILEAVSDRTNQPFHLVGISMGGTIALQLALDNPTYVQRLVLVSTFARLRPSSIRNLIYYARRLAFVYTRGISSQADFVARRLFPDPDQELLRLAMIEQIHQSDERVYRQAMRALGLFDVSRRLAEIAVPTLVVTGSRDSTVPPTIQAKLASGILGARQVVVEGAGHGVTADHPVEFNQVLIDFLSGLGDF